MSQVIKIKSSSTPASVPTTTDVILGELAVNTYDGKLYMKKDDGSEEIVQIGAFEASQLSDLVSYEAVDEASVIAGITIGGESVVHVVGQVWQTPSAHYTVSSTPVVDITDFNVYDHDENYARTQEQLLGGGTVGVFPKNPDTAIQNGDTIPSGITTLRHVVNTTVDLLILWGPSSFPNTSHTLTSIVADSTGGYTVTTNQGVFTFTTVRNRNYRDENDLRGWGGVGDNTTDNSAAFLAADGFGNITLKDGVYFTTSLPTTKVQGINASYRFGTFPEKTLDNTYQWLQGSYGTDFQLLRTVLGINAGNSLINNSASALTAIGDHAMENNVASSRLCAVGNLAMQETVDAFSLDAFGTSAMQSSYYGDRSVGLGHNASKWNGTNDPVAHLHDMYKGVDDPYNFNPRWPTWRADYAGGVASPSFVAATRDDFENCVSVGRNSLLHGITIQNNTAVGYNSHAHALNGAGCVAIGSGALRDGIDANNSTYIGVEAGAEMMRPTDNTCVGSFTMRNVTYGIQNATLGSLTLNGESAADDATPSSNIAVGASAMRNFQGDVTQNIAIGSDALRYVNNAGANLGVQNVAVGVLSMAVNSVTSNRNTAIGYRAAEYFDVAQYNTALGAYALRSLQNGNNQGGFTRCTGVGYDSRVSGSNQVQLGDSTTTTYAYGAVQDRSDERDKADIQDLTDAHIAFFMDVEWKMYRLDYRDDYIELVEDEEGNVDTVIHEKDGSRKRSRLHCGAVAQQVEAAMLKHGVDFAGLQHHERNGGLDVYTIGYQEFIAIQGEIIQRQAKQIDSILARLDKAGI